MLKRLSKANELKAIRITKYLFRALHKILSPALKQFFTSLGLLGGKGAAKDSQVFLKRLLHYNQQNLPKCRLDRKGRSIDALAQIIKTAITGRNKVSHADLPNILANWKSYLSSWIKVAHLIGAKVTANKITRIRSYLSKARRPISPSATDTLSMINIFRKLELEKNKAWTKIKEEAAISIEDILFDNIMEHFSTAMRNFQVKLNWIHYTSVIDCYAQLKLLFTKCSPAHFKAPNGGSQFDMSHLQVVMDTRHASIHEQHRNTLLKWENSFRSLHYVLLGIGAPGAARKINRVYNSLILARKEARRQIKRARFSPIFRNQRKLIKGKSDGTTIHWLKGRVKGNKHPKASP